MSKSTEKVMMFLIIGLNIVLLYKFLDYNNVFINEEEQKKLETLEIGRGLELENIEYVEGELLLTLHYPVFMKEYHFTNDQVEIGILIQDVVSEGAIYEEVHVLPTVDTLTIIQEEESIILSCKVDLTHVRKYGIQLYITDGELKEVYNNFFINVKELLSR